MRKSVTLSTLLIGSMGLSSCGVHKVVTIPAKGVYETTKFVGKAAVGTTKFVGKTAIGGTKMIGEGLWTTGKGVYYVGTVPVKVTNAALDTTAKVLTVTTQAVDTAGSVVTVSKDIAAMRLDAELAGIRTAKNILSVVVDVAK